MPIIKKDYGDTRYRSQVSRKYSGVTYGGQPAVPTRTPAGDLANALKTEATPFMEAYAKTSIQGKQDVAIDKLNKLRMSGKSADDIHQEIMSGQHPELESMYAKSAIDGQQGRFIAADTIAQIQLKKPEYTAGGYKNQSFDEFIAQSGVLPDFKAMSSAMTKGYATTFSEWYENEKITDATMRGAAAQDEKMGQVVFTAQQHILNNPNITDKGIMDLLKSFQSEIRNDDGTVSPYITNDEINVIIEQLAQDRYATCTDEACVDKGIALLYMDRGTDVNGVALGSVYDRKKGAPDGGKSLDTLMASLVRRKATLADEDLNKLKKRADMLKLKGYEMGSKMIEENRKQGIEGLTPIQKIGLQDYFIQGGFANLAPEVIEALDGFYTGIDSVERRHLLHEILHGEEFKGNREKLETYLRDRSATVQEITTYLSLWDKYNDGNLIHQGKNKALVESVMNRALNIGEIRRRFQATLDNSEKKSEIEKHFTEESREAIALSIQGDMERDTLSHLVRWGTDWEAEKGTAPTQTEIENELNTFIAERLDKGLPEKINELRDYVYDSLFTAGGVSRKSLIESVTADIPLAETIMEEKIIPDSVSLQTAAPQDYDLPVVTPVKPIDKLSPKRTQDFKAQQRREYDLATQEYVYDLFTNIANIFIGDLQARTGKDLTTATTNEGDSLTDTNYLFDRIFKALGNAAVQPDINTLVEKIIPQLEIMFPDEDYRTVFKRAASGTGGLAVLEKLREKTSFTEFVNPLLKPKPPNFSRGR